MENFIHRIKLRWFILVGLILSVGKVDAVDLVTPTDLSDCFACAKAQATNYMCFDDGVTKTGNQVVCCEERVQTAGQGTPADPSDDTFTGNSDKSFC